MKQIKNLLNNGIVGFGSRIPRFPQGSPVNVFPYKEVPARFPKVSQLARAPPRFPFERFLQFTKKSMVGGLVGLFFKFF